MSVTVRAAGVDTWSPCWYVDRDSWAAGMLDELAVVPASRGALLPERIVGHRIGWNRGVGMLYAEGHPSDVGLAPGDTLPGALSSLVQGMVAAGVPVPNGTAGDAWEATPLQGATDRWDHYHAGRVVHGGVRSDGFAGVRRLDSTADVACDSSAEGMAILAGVAAVARNAPRSKGQVIWSQEGQVETVYMRGLDGVKILGRWYDKGVEAGLAPRGRLIRPEDQRRFVKGTRRAPDELTSRYVRQKFHQRFAPLWQASKGVTVGGPIVLAEKLQAAVEAGELSPTAADAIAGHLLMEAVRVRGSARPSAATARRRRKAARDLGLVLADGVLQEVEVSLQDVMEQVLDSPAWGASG